MSMHADQVSVVNKNWAELHALLCIVSLPCLLVIADGLPACPAHMPLFRGAVDWTCSARACNKMRQKVSVPSGPVPLFWKQMEKNYTL